MPTKLLSVVIPNYNGNTYLKDCIDSIINTTEELLEIIVVDNGSTDSDYKWLEDYPQIIFKRLNRNYGFSRAVNEGIFLAKGEYIILFNNDALALPGFFTALYQTIEADSKIFSVCSKMIQYHDQTRIDDAGDEYNLLGWAYKVGDNTLVEGYSERRRVFSSCAGAAIYRKTVFEEIGYFDEQFFAYMEDVDISYRANIHGYKNIYCPDAKVYHIGSATSGSKYNSFKVKLAARNNIYVPYKNMPILQLLLNLPLLVLGYIIKYIFFIRKGFGKEYREGFIAGLKSINKLRKTPFKCKNIYNYIYIEVVLAINTFKYVSQYISRNKRA